MSMDLPYAAFEIQDYMVIFRQLETRVFNGVEARIRGIVRCTGVATDPSGIEADYRLDVFFLDLNSPFPEPIVDLGNRSGSIFMPISEMAFLVDVMRNEKPIYGHLRAEIGRAHV